jgi:hypothetical protein
MGFPANSTATQRSQTCGGVWETQVPLTPEDRLRRRRQDRTILICLGGSFGLLSMLLAVWFGTWLALLTGIPFLLLAVMAWREHPDTV